MRLGLFLPVSGRAATRETLVEAARQAERWGFDSVWAADRIVIPWQIETGYAYNESGSFFVPPDRPFLEALTTMAFQAWLAFARMCTGSAALWARSFAAFRFNCSRSTRSNCRSQFAT